MSTVRSSRVMSVAISPCTLARTISATRAQVEAERGQPVAIEPDLDLGVAALGRRLDVGEAGDLAHLRRGLGGQALEQLEVVAADLDLDRSAEAEVGRPPEAVLEPAGRLRRAEALAVDSRLAGRRRTRPRCAERDPPPRAAPAPARSPRPRARARSAARCAPSSARCSRAARRRRRPARSRCRPACRPWRRRRCRR